jgi:hypothetical protein
VLRGLDGRVWSELSLEAGVDALDGRDEGRVPSGPTLLEAPSVDQPGQAGPDGAPSSALAEAVFVRPRASALWDRASVRLRCLPDGVGLSTSVATDGSPRAITELTLAGGRAVRPNGACGEFRSSIGFASVFVPGPGEPVQFMRPAGVPARLGLVGDAAPGRLNALFSPPPFVFVFSRGPAEWPALAPAGGGATAGPEEWLAAAVRTALADATFTDVAYEPLDGGWRVRLSYEGHTTVTDWTSPELLLEPVADPWLALERDRDRHGVASPPAAPAWWLEPIFCGWGAQCARAAASQASRPADLACQANYDEWLATLARDGVRPGTVVIDDKWQASYGAMTPDPRKWPDLKGWIADRHAQGQKVLLWVKAWDPEGLPSSECVRDSAGRPVAADPANPAYRRRLSAIVEALVSPEGLDADGCKVDFTQRGPSGAALTAAGPEWGVLALHTWLATLHRAAKRAKPDALIITHTVNPLFRDVMDMARMNDVSVADALGRPAPPAEQLAVRARVARAALGAIPLDTDQWPMPSRAAWLDYARAQARVGVPALYYVDAIDNSGEPLSGADRREIARLWRGYRAAAGLDESS